MLFALYSG